MGLEKMTIKELTELYNSMAEGKKSKNSNQKPRL
jgi:hypothetical protein